MILTSGGFFSITSNVFRIIDYKVFDSIVVMFRRMTQAVIKFDFSGILHLNDHPMLPQEIRGVRITYVSGGVNIHSRR